VLNGLVRKSLLRLWKQVILKTLNQIMPPRRSPENCSSQKIELWDEALYSLLNTEDSNMFCHHEDKYGIRQHTWVISDARGIPLETACDNCVQEKMAYIKKTYRPEVLTDPNYTAEEPIEPS